MISSSERGRWKSRTGFLMAAVGSAIGLGNIWRFPFLAYRNGGGAFLIPFIIALVSVGIPLLILELGLGHKFRASAPLAFSRIGRRWEFLGWWTVAYVFVGILFYYCVVISWCLNYLKFAFGLEWGTLTNAFFEDAFLGLTPHPFHFGGLNISVVIGLAVVWIINWWIVYKGVRKGIELANRFLIPILGLIMVILVVWSAMLPGSEIGIKAYLWPDFSRLTEPAIWSQAFSQIFFSISVGLGIMIAYSSYLPPKTDIKTNAVITAFADAGFSIFAGFAVFATLGYMSFASGLPIEDVADGGPGLAFVTYPSTISLLPIGKKIFGVLFFLALLFAGISSSVSIFESAVSSVIDKFGWSRKSVTSGMSIIGFFGGLIFATGAGLYWLDLVDHFILNIALLTVGFLEAAVIGWVYRAVNLRDHINAVNPSGKKLGRWWDYVIAVWIPIVLGILIFLEIVERISKPFAGYDWLFVAPVGFGWIVMTLAIACFMTGRRWRRPVVKEGLSVSR